MSSEELHTHKEGDLPTLMQRIASELGSKWEDGFLIPKLAV